MLADLLADLPTWVIEHRCLEYQYTKIGRQTYFGQWTPQIKRSIHAVNTGTPNLADKPTLADEPPGNQE